MRKTKFDEIVNYVKSIIAGTQFEGHVYCVGGCVRDSVMHNDIKDIDMCVDIMNGGILLAEFMKNNSYTTENSVVIYETYGTAMFHLKEFPNEEIEVVQTRGEQYHDKNSRNPQVEFATLEEDCVRRDLTMNALYMNVSTGDVLDPTGNGIDDIKAHICRVTNANPDIVFCDDPLRILRVIRFSARYGFDIDPLTKESMIKNADRLSIITQERITDEFNKMITCARPVYAVEMMREIGVLKYVLPELLDMVGLEQNTFHFGDVYAHTIKVLENCVNDALPVRLACVLHDIGKIKTQSFGADGRVHFYDHEYVGSKLAYDIMMRMRYSKDIADEVCFYIKNHMLTKAWGDDLSHMHIKTLRKIEYICGNMHRFDRLMMVIDADNNAHAPEHCMKNQVKNIYVEVYNQPGKDRMFGYKLPVTGNDIMDFMGVGPGPDIKKYLDHCLKLAFMNPCITKEECLAHCKSDKVKGI